MNFKCFGQKILNKYHSPMPQQAFRRHLLICFAAAVLLRIVLAWPALNDPATLLRPDSMGYWNPARAVAAGDGLVSEPGSDTLEVIRPVGYIAWLAAGILCSGDSLLFAGVMGILISAATIFPLAWGVQKLCGSKRAGTVGAWLWAVCITPIGAAPLILSDTLLGLLSAYQFCAAVYFIQDKKLWQFALLSLAAMAGALTKTVNLPVVLVGLPVILLAAWLPWQDTWRAILIWLAA